MRPTRRTSTAASASSLRASTHQRKRQRVNEPTDDDDSDHSLTLPPDATHYDCDYQWHDVHDSVLRHCEFSLRLRQSSRTVPLAERPYAILVHSHDELVRRARHHSHSHRERESNYQCELCASHHDFEGSARLHVIQCHSNLTQRLKWQGKPVGGLVGPHGRIELDESDVGLVRHEQPNDTVTDNHPYVHHTSSSIGSTHQPNGDHDDSELSHSRLALDVVNDDEPIINGHRRQQLSSASPTSSTDTGDRYHNDSLSDDDELDGDADACQYAAISRLRLPDTRMQCEWTFRHPILGLQQCEFNVDTKHGVNIHREHHKQLGKWYVCNLCKMGSNQKNMWSHFAACHSRIDKVLLAMGLETSHSIDNPRRRGKAG